MCGGDYLLPKRATNQEKPVNQAQEVKKVEPAPRTLALGQKLLSIVTLGMR